MKNALLLLSLLLLSNLLYSQDFTDTIYYKSGMVRAGIIYKESKGGISYQYLHSNGKVKTAFVRKAMLNAYNVGDERNSVASDWRSSNPLTDEKREQKKQNIKKTKAAGNAFAMIISAAVVTPIVAGIIALRGWI